MGCDGLFVTFNKIKPYLSMIALQFGYAGMYIITLISMRGGFSHWILVTYRHVVAAIVFAPFAYFVEKKTRPRMTKSIFFKIAVLAFVEPVLDQNMYYLGMQYTSATFASATVNILPALTFIMAVIFRLERINLKNIYSLAKILGTTVTVSGAMLMTLYKGPIIDIFGTAHRGSDHVAGGTTVGADQQHWAVGTIMLFSCIVGWSGFYILQNKTMDEYPAKLSLASLICTLGAIFCGIVSSIMEHDKSAWIIGFDSRLLACAYSGIVCSGMAYYVQSGVNKSKGPVFVTAFSPLSMIITAILGALILSEQIHLGSLLGAVVIVLGLYSVVWGKSKESTSDKLDVDHELPIVATKTSMVDEIDTSEAMEEPKKKVMGQEEP